MYSLRQIELQLDDNAVHHKEISYTTTMSYEALMASLDNDHFYVDVVYRKVCLG
jgi:hypothetical protein